MRLDKTGKTDEFRRVVKDELLPCMRQCANAYVKHKLVLHIAPALYAYESNLVFERFSDMSPSSRDSALGAILRYVLSRCPPDEPVDFQKLRAPIDMMVAKQACEIIREMSQDQNLSTSIKLLIDCIVIPGLQGENRERCCSGLIERDVLDIAKRLENIAKEKLPDLSNIKHHGYLVLAKSQIARLRAAGQNRGMLRQDWHDILAEADAIPNVADRVIVYTCIAEAMSVPELGLSEATLKKAEAIVKDIRNPLDRSDRLYLIAKSWKKLGKGDAAKHLLQSSLLVMKASPLTKERDEIEGQVLELAHLLDPDFASSLIPMVENPQAEHKARLEWGAKSLQRAPQVVGERQEQSSEDLQEMIGNAAANMHAELNAGAGILPHSGVAMLWLRQMVNAKFESTEKVAAWVLEYLYRQGRSKEELGALFQSLADSLKFCIEVGNALLGTQARSPSVSTVVLPPNLLLFKAGTRIQAVVALNDWVLSNAKGYLKIYDAYFTFENIEILRIVPEDVRVYIVTSWKAKGDIRPGEKRVEQWFREAWKRVSESDPPWAQVVILGTKSGNSPVHSRFILTEGKGLNMGSSLSGLGLKDTEFRLLDSAEAAKIASEFVDPLLGPQQALFNGEQLLVHTFVL